MAHQSNTILLAGLALALAGSLIGTEANAASFPCEKARSAIEKSICASPELSDLDEYLGRYFAGAKAYLRHAEACLITDQKRWLRDVRDACKSSDCLKRAYLVRLAVLHAVQPGVTSLRNVALPKLPPLVWIVPPASDEVAAPRNQATVPLTASGRIVDDIATGDGYVLQGESGEKVLIVPTMLLEEPSAAALASLARLPDARFRIEGRRDGNGASPRAFASSQCAMVYRTAP